MKNVTVETRLTINLTARDWQLYSSMEGVDEAAGKLNQLMEYALDTATTPTEAYEAGCRALGCFRDYGAMDTEPRAVLEDLVRLRFPSTRNY